MLNWFGYPKPNRDDLKYLERLREEIYADKSNEMPNSKPNKTDIAHAIHAFDRNYQANERENNTQKEHELFWTKWTFVVVSIYAGITFVLAVIGHNANVMNAESSRAWLGTKSASINEPLSVGSALSIFIEYVNPGREPAKEMGFATRFRYFSQKQWNDGAAFINLTEFKNSCFSTPGSRVYGISFPTSGNNAYSITSVSNSRDIEEENRLIVTNEILSGQDIATISGCIIYQTAGQTRHTAFCYNYQAHRTTTSILAYCTAGNDAD